MENPIREAALNYVREGISVVRIIPRLKRVYRNWTEYQRRIPTESEINEWFRRPYFQLGVVCGTVSNGLFALDFDGNNWQAHLQMLAERFPEILDTRTVRTGSGRVHFWCRCSNLQNIIERLNGHGKIERVFEGEGHEAIELRLDRCIMLAPPSTHPNGNPYTFEEPTTLIMEFTEDRVWEMVEFLREGQPERQTREKEQGESPELTDERQTRLANFYVRIALRQVEGGVSRNEKGFQLGCNLRDLGLDIEQARAFMELYQNGVPERDHTYTIDEAINSLESAYEDERKEPWIPDGFFGIPTGNLSEEQIQKLLDYNLTDAGNAESFLERHGDRFVFVPERKKWFMWDGVRWMEEEHEARAEMVYTARVRFNLATRIEAEDRQKAFRKYCKSSENMGKVKSSLEAAEMWKRKSILLFDAEPHILCNENGVVNLHNGEFRRSTHNDWLSKSTGVHYDPEAGCPRWLQFLNEIFLNDEELISFMQRMVGYTLTGDVSESKLPVLLGGGANGKSTFLEAIQSILGEYGQTASASLLKEKKQDDIPNDVARLCGARFCKIIEMKENITMNSERVKSLTGGDKVSARFLHQEWFEFEPHFKIWLAVNKKPIIKDTSTAIWRRICLIPFNAYFPDELQDKHLIDLLREEKSGILNWAIQGCLDWQRDGMRVPEKVRAGVESWRLSSDQFSRFVSECCQVASDAEVELDCLYDAYTDWWEENEKSKEEDRPFSKNTIKNRLKERFQPERERDDRSGRTTGWTWKGIRIAPTEE